MPEIAEQLERVAQRARQRRGCSDGTDFADPLYGVAFHGFAREEGEADVYIGRGRLHGGSKRPCGHLLRAAALTPPQPGRLLLAAEVGR